MDCPDGDLALALQLQDQFQNEQEPDSDVWTFEAEHAWKQKESANEPFGGYGDVNSNNNTKTISLVDPHWELTDPNPDIRALFLQFNDQYFWGKLAGIEVKWSPRMTLCAGLCVYEGHGGLCSVRLSKPLLQLRPRKDLVETLLHEMIHAYLFVTDNNKDHDGHGPEFQKHMYRLNKQTGTNITIYHTFHDEVDNYRQHWWRCDGPCRSQKPYFGYVKRSMNRAPSPRDPWWGAHQMKCGGTYTKVKEPEGYGAKKKGNKKEKDKTKISTVEKYIEDGVLDQKMGGEKSGVNIPIVSSKSKNSNKISKSQTTSSGQTAIDKLFTSVSTGDHHTSYQKSSNTKSINSSDVSSQNSSSKLGTIDSLLESYTSHGIDSDSDSDFLTDTTEVGRPSKTNVGAKNIFLSNERLKGRDKALSEEDTVRSLQASNSENRQESKSSVSGKVAKSGRHIPLEKTVIHTISNSSAKSRSSLEEEQTNVVATSSSGGPRISTISSNILDGKKQLHTDITTYSGNGQKLGQGGAGSSFLANLRKEWSQKSTNSEPSTSVFQRNPSHKRLSSEAIDCDNDDMSILPTLISPSKKKAKVNTIETFFQKSSDGNSKHSPTKNECQGGGTVGTTSLTECPVCQQTVDVAIINQHLDQCLQ